MGTGNRERGTGGRVSPRAARAMKPSGIPWLGDVPEGWEIVPLFKLVSQVKFPNEGMIEKNLLSLSYGRIIRKNMETASGLVPENYAGYNRIEPKDIVLRLTDLQNDQKSLRVGISYERGIVTSAYLTIRPNSSSEADYLACAIKVFDFKKGFYGIGSGVRQSLKFSEVKKIAFPLPPLPEQRAIAERIDREVTRVDALREKINREIERLGDYKKSLIAEAVTGRVAGGRVSPRAEHAAAVDSRPPVDDAGGRVSPRAERPMKPSGIPWLGDVPEGWDIKKGKYCLRQINRPTKEEDGVITCFRDGEVTLRSKRREEGFTVSMKEIGYQGIEPGDLVVHGMDGFAGSIGVSDSRGKASPVLIVLDTEQDKKFLMYYLRTVAYKNVFVGLATGIRVRSCDLRWPKLAELPYLLPPLPEQREIAEYLDRAVTRIDAVVARRKAQVEKLEAFKRSLIQEYVTGKREVK